MALRAVPDHPKFSKLKAYLGKGKGEVLGYLEACWHFCGKFTPQGDIGKYSDEDIELWIEWGGERGALIAALTKAGWLDPHPKHRLIVHDWHQHADKATKQQLGRTKKEFLTVPSDDEGHEAEGEELMGEHEGTCVNMYAPAGAGAAPEPVPEPEPVPAKDCSGFQQELAPEQAPASPPPNQGSNPPKPPKAEPPRGPQALSGSPPRGNPTRKPPESPPIRVETRQLGPNGMHRPSRIEIPPGLPPEHVELARTLRDVTDGRMSPDVPDADLVRFLLAEAEAAGMPPAELRALVVTCVRRQRRSNSRWRPESWGWFRMVLPSRMRAPQTLPELSQVG